MQYGEIRFLARDEQPLLPAWTKLLPAAWRERYIEKYRPARLEGAQGHLIGILQTAREGMRSAIWRKNAAALLEQMRQEGVGIVIPPAEGELPRDILPFAEGRSLAAVFAFAGAREALRRQGKEPAACSYLIAGGEPNIWRRTLDAMGNEVNHLSIFTAEPQAAEKIAEELYAERGLSVEIFSSPKNPAFGRADAILSCGMEQRAYEHILKRGCFWLDLAGNRPALRRILQNRPDIAAAEGFFLRVGDAQLEGRFAEAEAYLRCNAFRESFGAEDAAAGLYPLLKDEGFAVAGFSAFGRRVKIRKSQG